MQRVQAALTDQLTRQRERLELELREKVRSTFEDDRDWPLFLTLQICLINSEKVALPVKGKAIIFCMHWEFLFWYC